MYAVNMIPFIEDGCGSNLCVKNLPDDQSVWYLGKAEDPRLEYISINHFLLTSIACYERGAYFFDEEEGFWAYDPDYEKEIAKEIRQELESQ